MTVVSACLRSRKKSLKRELGARGGHCRVTVCYHSETAGHTWYESLVTRPLFGQPYQWCCGPAFFASDDKTTSTNTSTNTWVRAMPTPKTSFFFNAYKQINLWLTSTASSLFYKQTKLSWLTSSVYRTRDVTKRNLDSYPPLS